MYKLITLTQGKFARVDEADYEYLSKYKWSYDYKGYAIRGIKVNGKHKSIYMHRTLMGFPDGMVIDHIDGDGLNNTRANLRECIHKQNCRNRVIQANNNSGYKGVSWATDRNKWFASIKINGKHKNLGRYSSKTEAAKAYNKAAIEAYGEFAKLNDIKEEE